MDLHQYLDAVRKYWWAILVPAALAGSLGLYSASQSEASFRASVTFFVATRGDASTSAAVQGDQFATRRVNSYVALATTDRLAQLIVDDAEVELTPRQVRSMIGASGDLDTVLLTVSVTSASSDLALRLGESLSTTFVDLVDDVENGGGTASGSVNLEVVSGPNVREVPTRPLLGVAARGMMGLFVGLGLAVLLQLRDHTVRSEEDLAALGLGPILGSIPVDRRERSSVALYVEDRMQPVTAESFRHLRTSLQFLDVDRAAKVLVVSSSVPEEGKSFVSRNLALAIAATKVRVLLVEADLRRPALSEAFDLERVPGLSDVLAGRAPLDRALRPWGPTGLTILPSGYLPPNPSELLGSDAAQKLIGDLRDSFDVVIFDTPPLLPVTDGAVVAAHADGVLLVVRAGKTSRHQLAVSAQRLGLVGARYLGAVMNMVSEAPSGSYAAYERVSGAGSRLPTASPSPDGGALDPLDPGQVDPGPRAPGPSRSPDHGPAAGVGPGERSASPRERGTGRPPTPNRAGNGPTTGRPGPRADLTGDAEPDRTASPGSTSPVVDRHEPEASADRSHDAAAALPPGDPRAGSASGQAGHESSDRGQPPDSPSRERRPGEGRPQTAAADRDPSSASAHGQGRPGPRNSPPRKGSGKRRGQKGGPQPRRQANEGRPVEHDQPPRVATPTSETEPGDTPDPRQREDRPPADTSDQGRGADAASDDQVSGVPEDRADAPDAPVRIPDRAEEPPSDSSPSSNQP